MSPRSWVLGRRSSAGYAVVALALLATGVAGYLQVREAREAGDLARHTQRVAREIARLELDLVNAETGQRGYLLTGDRAYLEPYERGSAQVAERLPRLMGLTADNPDQQTRLRQVSGLISTKLAELGASIEQYDRAGPDAALAIVRGNAGKRTMDALRSLLRDAERQEDAQLASRLIERARRFKMANRVVVGASVLALIVVVLSTLLVNRNQRDRQRADRRVRESEERLRVTLRSIGDAVIATDAAGRVVFVNPIAESLTGWPEREARGRQLDEIFRIVNEETRAAVESPVTKVLRAGAIVGLANHTLLLSRDGTEIPIDDSGAPIRDGGGEIMGVVLVFRDVSDRKRADDERVRLLREQAARVDAERANEAKDEFLAVLSHELRSPLQGIIGWLTVLRESPSDPAQRHRAVQAIERGVRQQAQLVNDLLDASRIVAGKLRLERASVDLAGVVRDCIDQTAPAADEKGLEIVSDVSKCGRVLGDRHRLHQCVANVLANAVKFTPPQGRIEVTCRIEAGEVVVIVRDSGEGIAPEFLPFLFDRFSQAMESRTQPSSGLGLGLSIARQIIELHDGTIRATSEGVGRGATFELRVPMAPAEDEGPACHAPASRDGSDLAGLTVLVVDDDADTRESLALLLSLRGAVVQSAGSVAEALASYDRARPQVLISDISMPGENGYDLIMAIHGRDGDHKPVAVALTGFAGEDDRLRAGSAGFNAYLAKPVDLDELVRTVRHLVDTRT